jgi:spore germination cell wall hydrolase CwlJ-like protein
MLRRILDAIRRIDRSTSCALLVSVLCVSAAGTVLPSGHTVARPPILRTGPAPLPLTLEPEEPVAAIMNPASLVVRTTPIDISPLLQRFVIERMLAEQRCLAEAMYYEARGEGVDGEKAIAEVVFHRMRARGFPHSICGVVYQRAAAGHGCQFSFTCNGELDLPKSLGAWLRAKRLAGRILTGLVPLGDVTENAIAFHALDVQPGWGDHLVRTIQIGNHVFYRAAFRSTRSS